jgi:hypothetical protein
MSAGKYNFVVEQGSQHELSFRYKLADGTYQNLTSFRARMSVKDHITDTAYVYQATSDASADTGYNVHFVIAASQGTAANTGKFTLTIPAGITAAFTFGQGVYDLELVSNGGVVSKLLEGKFKVKPQVSE